jgi:serine O-acetyltransferase
MAMRGAFHYDLEKCSIVLYKMENPGILRKAKLLLMNMGLHCIAVYRFGQMAERLRKRHRIVGSLMRRAYLLMNYLMVLIHKVELHEETEIGPGFHISHVGNVLIGARQIGKNCTVTHNVTIGHDFQAAGARFPTIGDNVWIGTGSVVGGDVTIGDGVAISAGSILTRSIPARCLVAGNPARVVCREYDNRRMLAYRMEEEPEQELDPRAQMPRGEDAFVRGNGQADIKGVPRQGLEVTPARNVEGQRR